MSDSRRVCQFCQHWRQVESTGGVGPGKAECRRFPPVPAMLDGFIERVYPPTKADDDCYEWKQQTLNDEPPKRVWNRGQKRPPTEYG